MRVLYVGATGLVGRHVVPILASDFDLKLAAREPGQIAGLPVEACDITDFQNAQALMEGVDAVVNSAIESPARPDGSFVLDSNNPDSLMQYQEGGVEVNVRGAYHLYEAAARAGVRNVVYISSMTAVFGQPYYDYIPRDAPLRPTSFYACTKIFGENLGQYYAASGKLKVLCLRLGLPYSPSIRSDDEWKTSPRTRGTLVAVEDIAAAVKCALCELERGQTTFGVYPVISDSDASWVDLSASREIGYSPAFRFTVDGVAQPAS